MTDIESALERLAWLDERSYPITDPDPETIQALETLMLALGAEREWWCAAPDFLPCRPTKDGIGRLISEGDWNNSHPYPDRHRLCHWQWTLPAEPPA